MRIIRILLVANLLSFSLLPAQDSTRLHWVQHSTARGLGNSRFYVSLAYYQEFGQPPGFFWGAALQYNADLDSFLSPEIGSQSAVSMGPVAGYALKGKDHFIYGSVGPSLGTGREVKAVLTSSESFFDEPLYKNSTHFGISFRAGAQLSITHFFGVEAFAAYYLSRHISYPMAGVAFNVGALKKKPDPSEEGN